MEKYKFLKTGNGNLDELLSPDYHNYGGGFLIHTVSDTPIILIEGDTGTGKTTLSLQIAHAAIKEEESTWRVYYYSLEQSAASLINLSENFKFSKDKDNASIYFDEGSITEHTRKNDRSKKSKIHFCKFSEKPIHAVEDKDVFEQRMGELSNALKQANENNHGFQPVFFVDCLNAFSGRIMDRSDIYRLFQLFRKYRIPAIITLEKPTPQSHRGDELTSQTAEFLSDIAIQLYRSSSVDYIFYYLEIIKSRVCRQVPGKHLYKIRTYAQSALEQEKGEEHGIVVFPSIYYVLTKSKDKYRKSISERESTGTIPEHGVSECEFYIDDQLDDDLGLIINKKSIKQNASIAIIGSNGTHKLALGLNLAVGRKSLHLESKESKYAHALIINFGGSHDFNFEGIAWTKFNSKFRRFPKPSSLTHNGDNDWRDKYWISKYELKKSQLYVTLLSFKIGQLTPEECFDVIERTLTKEEKGYVKRGKGSSGPYTSAIICNSAELCTGFPLLKRDPLFLPSLLDLFNIHNLVTVSIGVENQFDEVIQETNFTLSARADYRINLFHYPDVMQLTKKMSKPTKTKSESQDPNQSKNMADSDESESKVLEEQLVGLIIDNVSGKHYSRQPHWIYVDPKSDNKKILYCKKNVREAQEEIRKIQNRFKKPT